MRNLRTALRMRSHARCVVIVSGCNSNVGAVCRREDVMEKSWITPYLECNHVPLFKHCAEIKTCVYGAPCGCIALWTCGVCLKASSLQAPWVGALITWYVELSRIFETSRMQSPVHCGRYAYRSRHCKRVYKIPISSVSVCKSRVCLSAGPGVLNFVTNLSFICLSDSKCYFRTFLYIFITNCVLQKRKTTPPTSSWHSA
jgi:hypothetical protein